MMTPLPRPGSPPLRRLLSSIPAAVLATALAAAPQAVSAAAAPRAGHGPRACTGPAGDAFYVPPSPLPSGPHGTIIRCRPVASPVTGATAWQVLYLSSTVTGASTAVSGTVLVPTAAYQGTRPVVAYAAGTQGWGDQCAPSKEMAAGSFDEQFAVSNLLSKGWAVAVTGLSASAPMAIEGYSQGGGAADWAAQEQPGYAPGMHLKGVAAGGTPANLQAVAANINGTVWFAFLAGSAIGFNAVYPSLNLRAALTPAGRTALAQLDTMCQAQALLTYAGKKIQDYTVGGVNPISQPKWQAVLNANNLGTMKPAVPLLQYHGLLDEVIPYGVESALHGQYCAMGVTTQLNGYVGDHVLTQIAAQTDVVNWLGARFAGRRPRATARPPGRAARPAPRGPAP